MRREGINKNGLDVLTGLTELIQKTAQHVSHRTAMKQMYTQQIDSYPQMLHFINGMVHHPKLK